MGPRLLAAVGFIRPSDRVLDIGTDHARLPVYLMEHGLCAAVTGSDCAEGPLGRARRTVQAHRLQDRIPLVLCDGAEGLDSSDFDTVVIAGMGADTIYGIVRKCPWIKGKRLIAQPQTRVARFAEMMEGFHLLHQTAVPEGRRLYHIFVFDDAGE